MKTNNVFSPNRRNQNVNHHPRAISSWGKGIAFLLCLLLFNGCFEPELEPLNFFNVTTQLNTPTSIGLTGQVMLNGTLRYDAQGPREVENLGFYWATSPEDLEMENANRTIVLPTENDGLNFSAPSPVMDLGVTYYYQAFAQQGERLMRGELRDVSYEITTQLLQLERQNDSILFRVGISQLAELGLTVEEFGFAINKDTPATNIQNADKVIRFGPQIQNFTTDTLIGDFEFNTTYYATVFYQGNKEERGPTITINVTDGWTRLPSMPKQLKQATTIVAEEEAWIMGGVFTLNNDRNDDVYRFNPGNDLNPWSQPAVSTFSFEQGLSVVWNDEIYYWSGLQESPSADWFPLGDMIPIFDYCPPIPDFNYFNGVAFSLGNRFYFGTGRDVAGNFTDQFWEISLTEDCTLVRSVAPLPVTVNGNEFMGGRQGAISFVLDGDFYVGGGRGELIQYQDLYRFSPPPPDDPTAMGSWEFVSYLPGAAREEAIAFTADNRAFFGFGFNPGVGYFNDLWEYDPASASGWLPRETCPGVARSQALGLGINEFGYLMGGYRQFTTDGIDFNQEILEDVWSYTPESN